MDKDWGKFNSVKDKLEGSIKEEPLCLKDVLNWTMEVGDKEVGNTRGEECRGLLFY